MPVKTGIQKALKIDEKLLPFAIEEFGNECWVYGSDIRTETASTARSMSSSSETTSAKGASESCSLITRRAFTGSLNRHQELGNRQ
jgi:hypothetical protein